MTAAARVVEADVCIIGAGITSAMVAERVAEDTDASIVVVEAGSSMFNFEERTFFEIQAPEERDVPKVSF